MSDRRKMVGGKGLLVALLTRRPWLIPFIYHVYSLQGATLDELRELLGLKTSVIKRGLWWLIKHGIIERSGDKYVVSRDYSSIVGELIMNS
jgi:hypothetical protein